MRLYQPDKSTMTTEGVNDPNIFKAVFMAGAPGAGKTTVANQLFSGTGLKHLNVDRFWQLYKSKEQLGDYEEFWDKYQAQDDLYTKGRLGLLIDGTAKNPAKMNDVKRRLESIGYETAMVFVNTDLETAIRRAQKRASTPGPDMGRNLDTQFIKDAWYRTQKALGNYQSVFGDRFYIVDNSNKSMTSSLDYAERQLRQWLSAPPRNPIAKKWIQQQRQTSTEHTLRDWIDIVEQYQSQPLTETFTDPYPVRVLVSNDEAHHADVYLDDGSRLEIRFDLDDTDPDYGEQWDLEFLRDDTQKITGEKDAFRIFATVIEAIKQFIKSRSPDVISFSAEKNYDGESRFKLYKRMVDKLADQMGYVAKIADKGHYADFQLFSTQPHDL